MKKIISMILLSMAIIPFYNNSSVAKTKSSAAQPQQKIAIPFASLTEAQKQERIKHYNEALKNARAAIAALPQELKTIDTITADQAVNAFKAMRKLERAIWITLNEKERQIAREKGCPGGICRLGLKKRSVTGRDIRKAPHKPVTKSTKAK